jgi:hypothetical protein
MNTLKAVLLVVKVLVVAIAVLVGVAWWHEYRGTPQYSLALLAEAVKAKDYETARYFVDDERIADTASKSFLDAAMSRATKEIKADDNPFSGFGVAAIQMMAPRLRETAKDQIKDSIRQALSGNDTLTVTEDAQRWNSSRFSDLRIEECVVSGNTAEVVIRGIPQPNPAQITEVHLRMARIPDSRNWRIEEIPEVGQALVKLLDAGALQKSTERTKDLDGDETTAAQNLSDLYSPEKVAEYCRTHAAGFYGAVGSASGVSCPDWVRRNQLAIANWQEVKTAEQRLFGTRTGEVDSLGVMSEALDGTLVISTRCMAHFCPNHSAKWIVDLSTGKAAGEITSDGVMDKSGKAEIVVCLGDYGNLYAIPSQLQHDIKDTLAGHPNIRVSYVPQIQ